ncbi:hypothetical protein O181_046777 [Austropuccinia psidii MF-1]|uniref:Uncharacterized protein n=1 Tax=Austropuccinia psidii MF-1 TaxID=1389203 RepID=A0A9Q3DWK2_9BASI|nr:hypothetical protein [Austropuccinia psidii MF-1]
MSYPFSGPSQGSNSQLPSHENNSNCDPEPEVGPMQSTEAPFYCPATPCSIIINDNIPIGSPLTHPLSHSPATSTPVHSPKIPPVALEKPIISSPWCKEPLIPAMRLCRNSPNCNQCSLFLKQLLTDQPTKILLKHLELLHMIPFMDATH